MVAVCGLTGFLASETVAILDGETITTSVEASGCCCQVQGRRPTPVSFSSLRLDRPTPDLQTRRKYVCRNLCAWIKKGRRKEKEGKGKKEGRRKKQTNKRQSNAFLSIY